jgi:hypothetical protein
MTMNDTNKLIDLKKERSFGEMLGMPFTFLFQEFKGLMGSVLRYAGPFFGIAVIITILFYRNAIKGASIMSTGTPSYFSGSFILMWIVFSLSFYMAITVTIQYISKYSEKGKGNFTISEVGENCFMQMLKVFGGMLLMGVIAVPFVFLFSIISYVGPFLLIIFMIYIMVNLSLFPVIIVHEKTGIFKAFGQSFEIMRFNWWFSFGVYAVFYIMIFAASYFFILLVGLMFGGIAAASGGGSTIAVVVIGVMVLVFLSLYLLMTILFSTLFTLNYFNLNARDNRDDFTDRINAIKVEEQKQVIEFSEEKVKKDLDNYTLKNLPENPDEEMNRFKPKI